MKITRNSTKPATVVAPVEQNEHPEWVDAQKLIREAIDLLAGPASQGCEVSKEAIANLSVVLFDLA